MVEPKAQAPLPSKDSSPNRDRASARDSERTSDRPADRPADRISGAVAGKVSGFTSNIIVRGAKEHNLKNLNLEIPRNQITVVTGLSGSGKSSLAFDTIYAEGQRRYIESLSAYARNFLEQLKKPDVELVTGLSPAIAIDQRSVGTNPRSTVGTVTEIYDYLRLLFAKVGTPHCPEHKVPVTKTSVDDIVRHIFKKGEGTKFFILAPVVQGKKGEFLAEFQKWAKKFVKAKVDGQYIDLAKATKLAKTRVHDIDLVIDQLVVKESLTARITQSVQTAMQLADGRVVLETTAGVRENFSLHSSCPICNYSFPELEPRLFSFNNPRGACTDCNGLGTLDYIEEERYGDSDYGGKKLESVRYHLKNAPDETSDELDFDPEITLCPSCKGSRLRAEPLHVLIHEKNIAQLSALSLQELKVWVSTQSWDSRSQLISEKILKQIVFRVEYLLRVGTGYLSLDRSARTLSGGEAQRIRLATQVGSGLIGVLYVMDEPSIGLHPRDHHRLLKIIDELKRKGNTILLVEHDEDTIRFADHVIDLGPRAGRLGGELMALGKPEDIANNPNSLTGLYLSGQRSVAMPKVRRVGSGQKLRLLGASGNNLQKVNLEIPLGTLVSVTGVSGSGKSTLIIDTLYKTLAQHFYDSKARPEAFEKIEGLDHLDKVIEINQKPIGRTPRSIPATYVGLFPLIRDLFAKLPESKIRGFAPGQFSFNVKGGRCETCQGYGQIRLEMHFLTDVFVPCDVCNSQRYSRETLEIRYKGKSISDVLKFSIGEAREFFKNHNNIFRKLDTLHRVGLDYMTLGQSSTTLSGGEAQRVKLSKELSKRGTGRTLYILDEPTTGLHFEDIRKLVELLQELVEQGNTVLVIEHNLEVVKASDHVVDLGPDGGIYGGRIVATGTPEDISAVEESETGKYLRPVLQRSQKFNQRNEEGERNEQKSL